MGIFKGIIAAWKILSWLRTEKKQMEADVDGYLTKKKAKELRLKAEKIFRALEKPGNGNFDKLPSGVKWVFGATTIDNRIGQFGQWFLKSEKLYTGDKALEQPLYRAH